MALIREEKTYQWTIPRNLVIVIVVIQGCHLVSGSHPAILFGARCNSGVHFHINGINNIRVVLEAKDCMLNCSITIFDNKNNSFVEIDWLDFLLAGLESPGCQHGYIELSSKGKTIASKLCKPSPIYKLPLTELTIRVVLNGAGIANSSGCYIVLQYRRIGKVDPNEHPGRGLTSPEDRGKIAGIVLGTLLGCLGLTGLGFLIYSLIPKGVAPLPYIVSIFRRPPPLRIPAPRPGYNIPRPRPRLRQRLRPRPRDDTISSRYTTSTVDSEPEPMPRFGMAWRMRMMPRYRPAYRLTVGLAYNNEEPVFNSPLQDTTYYRPPRVPVDMDAISEHVATMEVPHSGNDIDGSSVPGYDAPTIDDLSSASDDDASITLGSEY